MTTSILSPCGLASLLSVPSPRWIASRSTAGAMRREVLPRRLESLPSAIGNQRLEVSRLLFIPLGLFCTRDIVPPVFQLQPDGPL